VLHPPQYIRKEIEKEKKQLAQHYKFPRAQKLPAHLLLARFYLDEEKQEELIDQLQQLCLLQPTFEIQLSNFGFFPEHSIYIDTANKQPLIQFTKVLKKTLNPAPSASAFYFQAHIPIATQLTAQAFKAIQEVYAHRSISHAFIAQKISLLRRKEELDNPLELKEFEFCAMSGEASFRN